VILKVENAEDEEKGKLEEAGYGAYLYTKSAIAYLN
jgi:hypothetical protein